MKRHIVTSAIAIAMLTACNTDRSPVDAITPEVYWTKEQDVRLALNGIYPYLSEYSGTAMYLDAFADNSLAKNPWESSANAISAGIINPAANYGYGFAHVRRANEILKNVDKVSMDATLKKRYIAETRFLRAFRYFNLTQFFGDVPLMLTSDLSEDIAPKPEAQVNDWIINELKEAATDLPLKYSGAGDGNENGRVTKGAALALKARVELLTGKNAQAAATAQEVMNLGTYKLFETTPTATDFADKWESGFVTFANDAEKNAFYKGLASYQQLFWKVNETTNPETILAAQFVQDLDPGISFTRFTPNDLAGWSSITPTIAMVNAYWKKDGTPFNPIANDVRASYYNNGNPKPEYLNEFKDRDTRLYASIMFPKSPWNNMKTGYVFNWPKGSNNTSITGYNYKKFVDPKEGATRNNSGNDWILIRYAEVLLTYAEAKNEVSGPDASIYDALDLIRKRVAMPTIPRTQTQASLREIIRNERRIELANEGLRYADIRRWNIAPAVMKTEYDITNSKAQDRVWEDRFKRLPYPQTAVDKNPLLKPAQAAKGY